MAKAQNSVRAEFWGTQPPWEAIVLIFTGICVWFGLAVASLSWLVAGVASLHETYVRAQAHFEEAHEGVTIYRSEKSRDMWTFSNGDILVEPLESDD